MRNNVDLPQPLAPSSASFSPRRTSSDTPSSAANRPRYAYDASRTASTVSVSTTDDTVDSQSDDGRGRDRGHECDVEERDAQRCERACFSVEPARNHRHVYLVRERV